MNRLCAALALLLISCSVSILSLKTVRDSEEKIGELTEQIISSEEEDKSELIDKLQSSWEKSYTKLGVFVSHQHLEDTEKYINSLNAENDENNRKQIRIICKKIDASLRHLSRSEVPYIDNIF